MLRVMKRVLSWLAVLADEERSGDRLEDVVRT